MTSFHPRKYDSSLFTENVLPMTSGATKYTLAQYAPFPYYSSHILCNVIDIKHISNALSKTHDVNL